MPRWLTLRANLRCEFLVLVICWRVLWTLWLDEDVGVRRSRILSWGLFGLFAGVLQMMFWIEHSCQMLWNHCWVVGWGDYVGVLRRVVYCVMDAAVLIAAGIAGGCV